MSFHIGHIYNFNDLMWKQSVMWQKTAYRLWMRHWIDMCWPFADAIFSLSHAKHILHTKWKAYTNVIFVHIKTQTQNIHAVCICIHTFITAWLLACNFLTIDNDVDKYLLSFSPQLDKICSVSGKCETSLIISMLTRKKHINH